METIIKYYFIPTSMTVIKDGKNKHGGKYGGGKIKRSTLEKRQHRVKYSGSFSNG